MRPKRTERHRLRVFSGMAESIAPMWSYNRLNPGLMRRLPLGDRAPVRRTRRKERALFPSFAMSSGRLFLDRVARQHCPSPLHRQPDHKVLDRQKGRTYH